MEKKAILVLGIIGVVVVIIISLVTSSLKKLTTDEVGLKYDTIWKKLSDTPDNEGLHLGKPGFQFIVFPSVFKTITFESLTCLNKDGVSIELDVSYQYQARAGNLKSIVMQFRDHEGYSKVLTTVGAAAIHEACSLFNTSQFQAERGAFQESVRTKLVNRYNVLSCDVNDLQVNNIRRPSEIQRAVQQKEAARENIIVAENEKPRKITQATTVKREAMTQANITIAKAESQARIIVNKATAAAEAILNQYEVEANTYKTLVGSSGLSLTTEGFLSYIGVRVISNAKNPVYVGLKSPAKSSYTTT